MRDMTKQFGSIVLLSLVLFSSVGAPLMASPVQAQSGEYSDGWIERGQEATCEIGGPVYLFWSNCSVEYGDVDGATAEQVHYDIYADGVMMQDQRRQTVKQQMSYIEQTQGIGLAHAKIELVECMNEGKTQAKCENQARQEVTTVFSEVQKSLYVSQNRQMQHWRAMDQQVEQTDNLSPTSVYPIAGSDFETYFSMQTIQLYNGEEVEVLAGYAFEQNSHNEEQIPIPYYYNGNIQPSSWWGDTNYQSYQTQSVLNVQAPSQDGEGQDTAIALSKTNYKNALTTLDSKYDGAMTSVHDMADSIYSSYDPGEVQTQDVAGPLEVMVTSSTNNDPLTYRLKSAQAAGYAVADSGKTVKVESDFDDDGSMETKSGVIYSDADVFPENTVKTGTTYVYSSDSDSSTVKISGSVSFVSNPQDAEPEDYSLEDQKFTVTQVYDDAGEKASSMTLQSNDFATTDTDKLNEQMSELIDRMEALEDKYEANQGGGGGSGISQGDIQNVLENFLNNLGIGLAGGGIIAFVVIVMIIFAYIKILTI